MLVWITIFWAIQSPVDLLTRVEVAGVADLGGANKIIEWDEAGRPLKLNSDYIRDEGEQATYIRELLEIYHAGGADIMRMAMPGLPGSAPESAPN